MGEIADQMINGEACELCAAPFENPQRKGEVYEHGYPVICKSCWRQLSDKEKQGYQKATVNTFME